MAVLWEVMRKVANDDNDIDVDIEPSAHTRIFGLKACPFCGSSKAVTIIEAEDTEGLFVICSADSEDGLGGCGGRSGWGATEEAVKAAWNQRGLPF